MTHSKKTMAVAAAALAMCMAAGSALAQDHRFGGGRNDHRAERAPQGRLHVPPRAAPRTDFRADPRRFSHRGHVQARPAWHHRGGYLPATYRTRSYVVNDWRTQRLQAPPSGYQWVGVDGTFVLAAIATGLIANIIAGY